MPKQNADFWKKKLSRNIERDGEVTKALRRNGWRVIRIWEHELNSVTGVARRIGMPKPGERNARTKRSRAA
jgi:DNA mismatch endonuclease (patch repair protein)